MAMSNVTALSGPCWRHYEKGPSSMEIPDDIIAHFFAITTYSSELQLIPSGRTVIPQLGYNVDQPLNTDPIARQEWFFGIHTACEEIANQIMQSSLKSQIRSPANLWMTLDRRCMKTQSQGVMNVSMNFLPNIPENRPGEPLKLGLSRYYIPNGCIYRLSNERDGWWDDDPLHIPNLTSSLVSALEQVQPPHMTLRFRSYFAILPQEIQDDIKDLVMSSLMHEPFTLDCNYLVPQSFWKSLFLQVPFLWDVDEDIINKKLLPIMTGNEWNWEKITRQILTPVEALFPEYWEEVEWDYNDVGLVVPPGLNNRHRIWQIVEEMYPNDVEMEHCG
ncbi:hypothetical protein BGZ61DRAFT_497746 [Ilyonectria robusta]|uniref:uncharacterized protein n=1 Tax=Ilyonectria robusta TaxID=1079257 RepID=UPI001E8D5573|nr:uncharacterized protein BGZ61DRAFT_497746 [Ilyonectria robusta]KAH8670611.1 hypothetical protein BGZ61DRAFT_497746 [Ilyonectria robusta]